jgi:NADPH:quinone reductase-like Zn-dependent oxidoreductase
VDKISPLKLFDENKTLMGFNLRRLLFHQNQSEYVAKIFDKVIGLWKDGKVKPVIDSTWAFEDVNIYFLIYPIILSIYFIDICKYF